MTICALSVSANGDFTFAGMHLETGDTIFLHTDGINEAWEKNPEGSKKSNLKQFFWN